MEPPPPEDPELPSGGGGPVDPGNGGDTLATGRILTITTNYAETFSGETTDDYSRPTNAYLPKGTTDVLVKSVYDSASKNYYYLLGCGRRVYQRDAQVYQENGRISANTLTTGGVTVSGGYTQLEFQSLWHVPYNLQLLPQSYLSISGSGQPGLRHHLLHRPVCGDHFLLHAVGYGYTGCLRQPSVQPGGSGSPTAASRCCACT